MRIGVWLAAALAPVAAVAGEADVIDAKARSTGDGTWTISATVRHADEGWDHYADAFQVVSPSGEVIGTRVLYHPHVEEQPFTRSLTGVAIPADLDHVIVRAGDKIHGYGGKEFRLGLPR